MSNAQASKPTWMAEGAEKRVRVQSMFAQIASRYDLLNSVLSCRLHYHWRETAANKLQLEAGARVLDLCCGTGWFGHALRRRVGSTGQVFGVDFCLPMIEAAPSINRGDMKFVLADGMSLPFASDCMDGLSVGWGIRNMVDVDGAHQEIYRVLKPGARFVSIDMAQPQNPFIRKVSMAILKTAGPDIAALFGARDAYLYLPKSTERFQSRKQLAGSMKSAGFVDVAWQDVMFGSVCIHWGRKL